MEKCSILAINKLIILMKIIIIVILLLIINRPLLTLMAYYYLCYTFYTPLQYPDLSAAGIVIEPGHHTGNGPSY